MLEKTEKTQIFLSVIILIIAFLFVATGCSQATSTVQTITEEVSTPTLPDPPVTVVTPPEIEVVDEYLEAWKTDSYSDMYALIDSESKNKLDEEQFSELYKDFAREIALGDISYKIISERSHPGRAEAEYEVTFKSNLFGNILRPYNIELILEDGDWRIIWDEALIMSELAGGNILRQDPIIPGRASIYDAAESPLASKAEAVAVGLYPDSVFLEESEGLLTWLTRISGLRVDTLIKMIEDAYPGAYLPIGEVLSEGTERIINALSGYSSVVIGRYNSRFYPDGGIAPHVVGYVSAIQQDEVDDYRRLGYQSYEKVGREGLEDWGEEYLSGTRGGSLFVIDPDGKIVGQIAQAASTEGADIYTTIDNDFQQTVQDAITGFRGAAVVMERDTGKILAMASSPDYNPNGFQTENINWDAWLEQIYSDLDMPLFNRASQGQYPLGSVFKIITMAAGLESGVYTPETTYECGYFFEEALGLDLNDWTYDWFLEDGVTQPSGLLTLPQGLIRSCNPFFWHIGLDLYNQGLEDAVPDMARGFGLGSPTGIIGIEEEAGNVSDPGEPVDAINMAIGQGEILVTPLQVANFVAAIGNGGTLNKPWIVDRVVGKNGNILLDLGPEEIDKLPISAENLKVIQDAMQGVVFSTSPRGTAYTPFNSFKIPIAGKTGTAESGLLNPHAWFVAYSLAEREDKPDIAVAVIVENVGEGSEWAAPIVRRILELYFYGTPQKLYRWESGVGVTKTPTPIVTDTPSP